MGKSIRQVLALALFLFLAAFSSIWFEQDEEKQANNNWISMVAGKTLTLVDGLVRMSSPASTAFPTGVREEAEMIKQAADSDVSEETAGIIAEQARGALMDTALPLAAAVPEDGFGGFVRDVFSEAPERYLDAKLYNRGLKDFFSFYWLKLQEMPVE